MEEQEQQEEDENLLVTTDYNIVTTSPADQDVLVCETSVDGGHYSLYLKSVGKQYYKYTPSGYYPFVIWA